MPIGVYKHKKGYKREPFSEEWKANLSAAHKGRIPWNKGLKGYNSDYPRSQEWKDKISFAQKGIARPWQKDEKHHGWKGNKVGYGALHIWLRRKLGSASYCSFDKSHTASRFHWANISGSYLRDFNDWTQLCPKCHKEYDNLRKGKNLKGGYTYGFDIYKY